METVDRDAQLLERIREDAPGAFEQFVEQYGDRIVGYGMRVCGEHEDARDVAQDTLLQAYRSLKELREPRALRSWLYKVVSNACRMRRRRRTGEPERELSLEELMPRNQDEAAIEIPDPSEMPDETAERHEIRNAVLQAIESLPDTYRMVMMLRDIEQLSTHETAEVLQLPESTVKMRLHRARLAVRQQLVSTLGSAAPIEEPS